MTNEPCPLCERPMIEMSDLLVTKAINALGRMIRTTKHNVPGARCFEEDKVLEELRSELRWRVKQNEHVSIVK